MIYLERRCSACRLMFEIPFQEDGPGINSARSALEALTKAVEEYDRQGFAILFLCAACNDEHRPQIVAHRIITAGIPGHSEVVAETARIL